MTAYVWDVTYSESKDTLKAGVLDSGCHRVAVLADSPYEARLIADQMVACHGEPTGAERVDGTDPKRPWITREAFLNLRRMLVAEGVIG